MRSAIVALIVTIQPLFFISGCAASLAMVSGFASDPYRSPAPMHT